MLVGSVALRNAGINIRKNYLDADHIVTWEDFQEALSKLRSWGNVKSCYPLNNNKWVIKTECGAIVEYEIAWEGSTGAELLELCESNLISTIDVNYTLKMSHRYKRNSPHFLKTMRDIKILRDHGAVIPECLQEWFKRRERETYEYGHPKLNMSKKDFFKTEGVVYTYDHDSIHEAVKLGGKPAYSYFKPEEEDVLCSKEMFFSCREDVRLNAVFEESCVLALERALVPYESWHNQDWAFKKALEKVCTSITSGWFREFAWENYYKVLNKYLSLGSGWLEHKFREGLKNNTIKLIEEK